MFARHLQEKEEGLFLENDLKKGGTEEWRLPRSPAPIDRDILSSYIA